MSYAPFIETIKIYKGTTFSYQFNFNENDSSLDLTALSDIEVTFSKPGQEIFKHTIDEGDLTISGADDNELTGTADADTMDIGKRSYDLTITFVFPDGSRDVYVDFDAEIVEGENQTAHEWNIEIDTDAETASGEQLTGLTSRALQAADSLTKRGLLGYREYVARIDLDSQLFDSVTELKNELSETIVSVEVETLSNIEVHISFNQSYDWDKISISTAGGYSKSTGDISTFFDGFLESTNNDTIGLSIQPIGSEIPGDSPLSFYLTVRIYD